MVISDFTLDLSGNYLCWHYNDKKIELHYDEIKDAKYYENENAVLVLSGASKTSRKLTGILPDGSVQFILDPPDGYCFYYLTEIGEDEKAEMAVACLDTTNARGFDVFFTIERRTHKLVEQGRKH